MGTHISRVKSVDLDSWTDEQLQHILKWGNLKANKYWESKLAADHLPSESKIENFIRTKYESKRWVMEGPIPDPSTLSADGDEDLPLSIVKEKQIIERSGSQNVHPILSGDPSQNQRNQQHSLFKNDNSTASREVITNSSSSTILQKNDRIPSKQTKPIDSLLGLDFFGTGTAPLNRPSSVTSMTGVQSRPDLKQSILSLYATPSRPPQKTSNSPQARFGSFQSSNQKSSVENISSAFDTLSFSSLKSPAHTQSSSASSELKAVSNQMSSISSVSTSMNRGNFFGNSSASKPAAQQTSQLSRSSSSSSGFGAFNSGHGSSPTLATSRSSGHGDILDFTSDTARIPDTTSNFSSPPIQQTSVFNLTDFSPRKTPLSLSKNAGVISNNEAWGSSDAWANSRKASPEKQQVSLQASIEEPGWGSTSGSSMITASKALQEGGNGIGALGANAYPIVSNDEEFGSWGSAPVAPPVSISASNKPAAGLVGNEDLFSNVWG